MAIDHYLIIMALYCKPHVNTAEASGPGTGLTLHVPLASGNVAMAREAEQAFPLYAVTIGLLSQDTEIVF